MPHLTPEQVARLRAKMTFLREFYANGCAYPYRQGEELKKTSKYKTSDGVCMAMSLDWLRRRLWNAYNPAELAKRNFDDAKYGTDKNRVALTNKHGKLQDVYVKDKKPGPTNVDTLVAKLAAASIVSSGMDRLEVRSLGVYGEIPGYEFDEAAWARTKDSIAPTGAPNAHFRFKERFAGALAEARGKLSDAAPAVGVLFEMSGDGGGHAVALYLTRTRDWFFDPNFGEYSFAVATQLSREINFVANVWFDVYHTFMQMDALSFSLVRYRPPAVVTT